MFKSPTNEYERIPFYNDSGETVPAFACMGVKAVRIVNGVTFEDIEKPSTTLRAEYLFNGPSTVAANKYGSAYRGPLFLCKTSPTNGQGFGPKPGQWELELGFPTLGVASGVHISSGSIYIGYGEYRPITTLLAKSVTALTANTSYTTSTNVKIYSGATFGSEVDAGFTSFPAIRSRTAIAIAKWIKITLINGNLECEPLEC